jgi:ComF family protein
VRTIEIQGLSIETPFSYRDPIIKKLIWLLKYRGSNRAATLAASALISLYQEYLAELIHFSGNRSLLLIPIPSSNSRVRARGYNQAELLADALLRSIGETYLENGFTVLARSRETESQTKMKNRSERLRNPKDSFRILYPEKIAGREILLLDDVVTTGATLREAKRVLKSAGAKKVHCFALAH